MGINNIHHQEQKTIFLKIRLAESLETQNKGSESDYPFSQVKTNILKLVYIVFRFCGDMVTIQAI